LIFTVQTRAGEVSAEGKSIKSKEAAIQPITLKPIGLVRHREDKTQLEIAPELGDALDGLSGFSHLWVLYRFHESARDEEHFALKVHPRRDPANPLTGVFATRAPLRPNLIGLSACRIVKIKGNVIEVADLDARDGSPILDLKPYIPLGDSIPDAITPEWVKRLPHKGEKK
jgi:tRNA-Thr(GGU) m(6)t(6)A37 methyltransferase TsaA